MINWELPHEKIACPHCGSTETHFTLQLLGLIRCSCHTCRKSFATHRDSETTQYPDSKPRPAGPAPGRA